ncbi:NAD(P)/FAD-dependent oxidoreductase [Mucilaginibacter sp. CSA2-8R]|uniref:phytoene desaturase family protein n=1 Tax=Mucilaginibacter sp. CSA2-8R TaxID=3141542 RepID=UPI00315DBF95
MPINQPDYDAVIVGSGPNGLAAAILLQQQGLRVLIIEGKESIGGGLRTAELTLPGFKHDICSAIHPLGANSPFLTKLPLAQFGLEYIYPDVAAAHPLDDGTAAMLTHSVNDTARHLGVDEQAYLKLVQPLIKSWNAIAPDVLGPLHWPKHPLAMAQFGAKALLPATALAKLFAGTPARALIAGMAAHAIQPLGNLTTAAIALVLLAQGHIKGWPLPKGGSQQIANAMAGYFKSIGGKIETRIFISNMSQLPSAHAVLFDVTPRQLLQIAGHRFSWVYKKQLARYRYGMGVFKIDWALNEPVPFTAPECRRAGTLHLGGSFEQIASSELSTSKGNHPEQPYVLFAQQSLFDNSRAPKGKHTAWAYCHVPHGSEKDMTHIIESQVERFAPGFKQCIIARSTMNTRQMEEYNPNYMGGDINGGQLDIAQLFTRPALRWSPYRTSAKGVYICSSSTPPGGGVHGMCGYYAAKRALKEVFGIRINTLN